ncbi:hypothetical protein HPP92_008890 [Vanilla planifolia]|uniref:Uncharacterized protein n=1 Tax=Vanilla planifolia TaxID=51239 RepID=A0A835V6F7_VANPL|nr:hypothetical protein HPP92_008890 [Vanilla planifolia]
MAWVSKTPNDESKYDLVMLSMVTKKGIYDGVRERKIKEEMENSEGLNKGT